MLRFNNISATVALLIALFTAPTHADILDFDDLPTDEGNLQVPQNYFGFDWGVDQFGTIDDTFYATYGNSYGSPSGEVAVYNWIGQEVITLTNSTRFNFIGAAFTGWALNDARASFTSTSITVEGYRNGQFIGSAFLDLPADRYDWLDANILNVDELRFMNSGGQRWWLMDDFEYILIPEPSTTMVVALGLSMVLWRRNPRR